MNELLIAYADTHKNKRNTQTNISKNGLLDCFWANEIYTERQRRGGGGGVMQTKNLTQIDGAG